MNAKTNKQINELGLHHKVIQLVYYFYSHHLFLNKISISLIKIVSETKCF